MVFICTSSGILFYGFFFIILFSVGALCLELSEGYKITTTEYYGLRNIGFIFIAMMFLIASVLYPVILFPLSLVLCKIVTAPFIRVILYSVLGGIGGILMFHKLYNDSFIQQFNLNISSSILIFGAVGFSFALMDNYLQQSLMR